MKKTTSISINNTLFHIEDDAFQSLDSYLKSIQAHFANNPDKDEIISDIEERIAEKFSEHGARVITETQVKNIIDTMGTVEQFSETKEESNPGEKTSQARRLYRNPDDSLIAGICSGLGVYLHIDTRIIRVLFIISIFFGGLGIFAYVILWIIIPNATTAAQKLSMRGAPVTLASLSKVVKDKINDIRK